MVVKGGVSVVGRWRKTVVGGGWSEDGGGRGDAGVCKCDSGGVPKVILFLGILRRF
ncbi:hypothetical protein HanRHA438_Chr15g0692001 [Helianthus annuus]|nr:hypothetical protein HanRHA438_Chr15g0692001 [Helianthus annuus]